MSTTASPELETGTLKRRRGLNPSALPTLAAVVIFVAMIVYIQVTPGGGLHMGHFSDLIMNNAHMLILVVGMTIVILTGGIDLSVGAVIAATSVFGGLLMQAGWNAWLTIVLMIAFGGLFGLIAGTLIRWFDVQPFIATLAMMFLARGLAGIMSTEPVSVTNEQFRWLAAKWKIIDGPKANDLFITPGVVIALLTVAAGFILLHRTRLGRTVYAMGGSESSAALMGLPTSRTKVLIYVIAGGLAGLASVVYTANLGKAQNVTGDGLELNVIAAVVIGGTLLTGGAGYVLGSAIGALALGLLPVLVAKDGSVPPAWLSIIIGGILLVFVLLQRTVTLRQRT